jgi:hypothetical protein
MEGRMFFEEWADIIGFEGYQISTNGRVRSYRCKGRIVKKPHYLSCKSSSYVEVGLRKDNKTHQVRVASLVLLTFVGPRPDGEVVRHLNDVKSDNRLSNLSYGSQSENSEDSIANKRQRGLTTSQVSMMRSDFEGGGYTKTELARKYGITLSSASRILNGSRRIDS